MPSNQGLTRVIDNLEPTGNSLAAVTGKLVTSKIDASREQGFMSLVQKGRITFRASDGAGGPVAVYLIQPGMSLAEAEEAIEADPQSPVDLPAVEQVKRRIWMLGFVQPIISGEFSHFDFHTKHKIVTPEGSNLEYMIYNTNLSVALDVSNSVQIYCEHLGVWLRD